VISPLILQAQITPPPGGGSFGLADTTRLENPFQSAMWIDEIRFRLPNGSLTGNRGDAWSRLRVELKLGNINLTNGFVPISLLGKVQNDSQIVGENNAPNCFTWKLPKPLYIAPREILRPTMYFEPYTAAPTKTVTIIYACRPIPHGTPAPTTMHIPWVTYFKPPEISIPEGGGGVADRSDQSTPADIYNPWDEVLHVQRFVGRLMGRWDEEGVGDFEDEQFMALASADVNLATGLINVGSMISAQDSFNNILIRDVTPFAHVFDFIDRAWTVGCVLPPKGFYLFTIDRLWANYVPLDAITATLGLGMVGWREVTVKRVDPRYATPLPQGNGRR